jgi:hypothetical protein
LLKAFRSDGVADLISKKRGRPSNRRTTASVRTAALWMVRHNYLGEHNRKPKPFVWTADPDRIIKKVNRGHQAIASNY